jgi:hypothetical protein
MVVRLVRLDSGGSGAAIRPSPALTARTALAAIRAEKTRSSPTPWWAAVTPYRCADG